MTLFIMFSNEAMCTVKSVYMGANPKSIPIMGYTCLHVCVLCVVMVT